MGGGGVYFFAANISNILWVLEIHDFFFFGEVYMLGPSLRMKKK